jgi:hypothetical protein
MNECRRGKIGYVRWSFDSKCDSQDFTGKQSDDVLATNDERQPLA